MSSKNNVNPDHYRVKGRERQGENLLHEEHRHRLADTRARTRWDAQQTSRKAGVASTSEKGSSTRHPFEPAPATKPVPGAFGKEGEPAADRRTREEELEDREDQ
ncbi:MAG: hypothetical protein HYX76_12130 [Acidobacteria bacterium]|nr:hypothetical protein [Acidobacteriota bacterium]